MKRKLKHIGSGIVLLAVLVFISFTSNSEFTQVRTWAANASHMSKDNSAQIQEAQERIDDQSAKIAKLEADLRQQNATLEAMKQQQAKIAPGPKKKVTSPPKSYPKPPADFVPLDQQKPKKKKKGWWPFG